MRKLLSRAFENVEPWVLVLLERLLGKQTTGIYTATCDGKVWKSHPRERLLDFVDRVQAERKGTRVTGPPLDDDDDDERDGPLDSIFDDFDDEPPKSWTMQPDETAAEFVERVIAELEAAPDEDFTRADVNVNVDDKGFSLGEQDSAAALDFEATSRGFQIGKFEDGNGIPCSLQESSAIRDEGLIWLGTHVDDVHVFLPGRGGWRTLSLVQVVASHLGLDEASFGGGPGKNSVLVNDRMHLTQTHVRSLLPALIHFAETGELPRPPDEGDGGGDDGDPLDAESFGKALRAEIDKNLAEAGRAQSRCWAPFPGEGLDPPSADAGSSRASQCAGRSGQRSDHHEPLRSPFPFHAAPGTAGEPGDGRT